MFVDAGEGLRIYYDYELRTLRVQTYSTLIPGFKPIWQECSAFSSAEAWDQSPFPAQISNENVQEDITWFWIDMEGN